jgi:hypothetical protein
LTTRHRFGYEVNYLALCGEYAGLDYFSVTAWAAWLWSAVAICATVLVLAATLLIGVFERIAMAETGVISVGDGLDWQKTEPTVVDGLELIFISRATQLPECPQLDFVSVHQILSVRVDVVSSSRIGRDYEPLGPFIIHLFTSRHCVNFLARFAPMFSQTGTGPGVTVEGCKSFAGKRGTRISQNNSGLIVDASFSAAKNGFYLYRVSSNPRSLRSAHRLIGYVSLPAGENGREYAAYGRYESKYLSPICLCLLGFAALTIGYWRGVHGRWNIVIWAPVILFGILAAVIGGVWSCIVFTDHAAVSYGFGASATCYRSAEYVRVLPVVVPELKFRDVQRHVLAADFVERAHDATFQQRPKTINRLSVNGADDVFVLPVANGGVWECFTKTTISAVVIGRDQADFVGNGFANEPFQRFNVSGFDDASDHVALALYGTDNSCLASAGASLAAAPLVPMFVAVLAADIRFIDFNNASEFVWAMLAQSGADTIAHVERSFVAPESHVAHDLERANSLFAGQHQVNDLEPVAERLVRVFEDCPDQNGEAIAARLGALTALPMIGPIGHGINVNIPASRAMNAFRPAPLDEVSLAIIISNEHVVKLLICKLFYRFDAGHIGLPYRMRGDYINV